MADETEGSITQFFGRLRAGDPAAAGPLWDRYFPRLLGLVLLGATLRRTLTATPSDAA